MHGSWNSVFLDELETFPKSRHDDQVDALVAAVTAHNPRPKSAIDLTALGVVNQLLVSPEAYDI